MQKIVRGTAIDLSSEGKGVVKYHDDIIFVDGLFPNEEADIEILYQRAGVYFGKVKHLYKLSKEKYKNAFGCWWNIWIFEECRFRY